MGPSLAKLLAAAGVAATLAVMVTGPVLARFKAVLERRDPIVTPFQRIYQRALDFGREEP